MSEYQWISSRSTRHIRDYRDLASDRRRMVVQDPRKAQSQYCDNRNTRHDVRVLIDASLTSLKVDLEGSQYGQTSTSVWVSDVDGEKEQTYAGSRQGP